MDCWVVGDFPDLHAMQGRIDDQNAPITGFLVVVEEVLCSSYSMSCVRSTVRRCRRRIGRVGTKVACVTLDSLAWFSIVGEIHSLKRPLWLSAIDGLHKLIVRSNPR